MNQKISQNFTCQNCFFNSLCLPKGLTKSEIVQLEELIQERRDLKRHQHLFQPGDSFKQLYVIRKGSFKSYTTNVEGDEQVSAFNFPPELLGLDGIPQGKHSVSMMALEDSSVCELPFDQLLSLATKIPNLQRQLFTAVSRNALLSQLNPPINTHAETRFAAFLFHISERLQTRGVLSQDFTLSMSREEIGNYLGLATETISRLFNRFEEKRILAVKCRYIHVNDLHALQTLSCM